MKHPFQIQKSSGTDKQTDRQISAIIIDKEKGSTYIGHHTLEPKTKLN